MVWRPLPVEGKLDHPMSHGPTCLAPWCSATWCTCVVPSACVRLTLSLVDMLMASVAGAPGSVWARSQIFDGGPVRPTVRCGKPLKATPDCWLGCPCGTLARRGPPYLLYCWLTLARKLIAAHLSFFERQLTVYRDAEVPADIGR